MSDQGQSDAKISARSEPPRKRYVLGVLGLAYAALIAGLALLEVFTGIAEPKSAIGQLLLIVPPALLAAEFRRRNAMPAPTLGESIGLALGGALTVIVISLTLEIAVLELIGPIPLADLGAIFANFPVRFIATTAVVVAAAVVVALWLVFGPYLWLRRQGIS